MLYTRKEYENIYLEPVCYCVDLMSYLQNLNKYILNDETVKELIDSELKLASDNLKDYSRFLSLIFDKDYNETFDLFFKGKYSELLKDEFILEESLENMVTNCVKPVSRLLSLATLVFDLLGVEFNEMDLENISNLDVSTEVEIILKKLSEVTNEDLSEQKALFNIIANMNYHIYLLKEEVKRLYGDKNLNVIYPLNISLTKDDMINSFYGLYLSYHSLVETLKSVYKGMTNIEYPTKPNMTLDNGLINTEALSQLSFYNEIEKAIKALNKYQDFIAYIYKVEVHEVLDMMRNDYTKLPSKYENIKVSISKTKTILDANYIYDNVLDVWNDMSNVIGVLEGYFKIPVRNITAPTTFNRGDKIIKYANHTNERLAKIFEKEFRVIAQTLDHIYACFRILDLVYGLEIETTLMSTGDYKCGYLQEIKDKYLIIKRD